MRQSNAVLLGALFCFAAQAGQFGLFGFVLLFCRQGFAQRGKYLIFSLASLGCELFPGFIQGDGLYSGNAAH
ncbi:hypothetical protein D3C78_1797990 [compost metagenome]